MRSIDIYPSNIIRKIFKKRFPIYRQSNIMDCGPTCLQMISSYYGRYYKIETLRLLCGLSNTGVNLLGVSAAAKNVGFATTGVKVTFEQLLYEVAHPSILFWQQKHFVVYLSHKKTFQNYKITIIDPAQGKLVLSKEEFLQLWSSSVDEDGDPIGFALTMIPQKEFFINKGEQKSIFNWHLVLKYFSSDYSKLLYISVTIIFSIICQLSVPYLTKLLVDNAIKLNNPRLVSLIILAQFVILFSKMFADFLRAKFLLVISTFININMSNDFWRKLMRLPLSFFEIRRGGDIFQRISDNKQVQNFLTGPAVNTSFSILTFITFAYVLFDNNPRFLGIFIAGVVLYYLWISWFFKVRRKINHSMNELATKQNDLSLQYVNGMSEIRMGNGEKAMLKEWDFVQDQLFKLNSKILRITQIQSTGGLVISQGKDLLIIFLAANLVIEQKLSLGALIAVQYVIGALASPIEQLVNFSQNIVDTKQSINRLNDVYQLEDESKGLASIIPKSVTEKDIKISGLSFAYPGIGSNYVLTNLNLVIPAKKVTAIVGLSGSGKTTLIKLLLRFYDQYEGEITIGEVNIRHLNPKKWRLDCGAVLQEGYIFNNTIERNITIDDNNINQDKVFAASKTANILDFINSLPNGFQTRLGVDGVNLSQGQKQRILIARAVYKDPQFLFFDEATNSLDAENERVIVDNLKSLYFGKTVVIIAHRLSTVKDADHIVVLDKGEILETGNHETLIAKRGRYFHLVKNQLELGV